jgi:Ca2+-binding RTX toxin-like protein
MLVKNLMVRIMIVVAALTMIGMILPTTNSVSAVTRFCNFPQSTNVCTGTNGGDTMTGDGQDNAILGCGGNDVISGAGGPDGLIGDGIDSSRCPIGGNFGADRISGGIGNDIISHAKLSLPDATDPDGHRDLIDCGPGNDEVFINVNLDNDVATNCEIMHVG